MAIEVISWVLLNSPVKNSQRLVLIVIANHANRQGGNAYPSVSTIAKQSQLDQRTVSIAISGLADNGHLKVDRHAGPKGTHRYSVVMDPPDPPVIHRPEESPPPRNHRGARRGQQTTTPGDSPPRRITAPVISAATPGESPPEPSLNRPTKSPSVDGSVRPAQERVPAARGTRIPENFRPDQKSLDRIRTAGFSDAEIRHHTELFQYYWEAKTGKDATKTKWNSTWCRWMLKETPGRWPGGANAQQPGGRNGTPNRAAVGLDMANELISRGL